MASIINVDAENDIILYEGNVAGTSVYYNTQSVKPSEFSSYWEILDPKKSSRRR